MLADVPAIILSKEDNLWTVFYEGEVYSALKNNRGKSYILFRGSDIKMKNFGAKLSCLYFDLLSNKKYKLVFDYNNSVYNRNGNNYCAFTFMPFEDVTSKITQRNNNIIKKMLKKFLWDSTTDLILKLASKYAK